MARHLLTPRMRLVLALVAFPLALLLVHHRAAPSSTPNRPPAHQYTADLDDGLDERFHEASGWNLRVGEWFEELRGARRTGKILVTGGAGQFGHALIPKLAESHTIHILDSSPRPFTLPYSSSIIYHRASLLPPSHVLPDLLASEDFDGIIHLASINVEPWCAGREETCRDVNVGGTEALLESVRRFGQAQQQKYKKKRRWMGGKDGKMPWVIMGSTTQTLDEHGAVGRTKREAEDAVKAFFAASPVPLADDLVPPGRTPRGAIVRLPEVYGYPTDTALPHAFIPSLLSNALTHSLIQYDSDAPPLDLLHVDDAVAGFMEVIGRVALSGGGLEMHNLVTGSLWSQKDVVDLVRRMTKSFSPTRDIGTASSLSALALSSPIASTLPSLATTPLAKGLHATLLALTAAQHAHSSTHIAEHCHAGTLPDQLNAHLAKLDGCTVNMAFDHLGYLHHLKCEDGVNCVADGKRVPSYNWNASVFIVRKEPGGGNKGRRARVRFEEEKGFGDLGAQVGDNGEVAWGLYKDWHAGGQTVFDIEVEEDASVMRMSLAAGGQIRAVPNAADSSTSFRVTAKGGYDMRMTVLCCPSVGDWPLLQDDFETADVRFGSTGLIPTNSSKRAHLCSIHHEALQHATAMRAELSALDLDRLATLPRMTKLPHNYINKDQPACWNDCTAPTVCLQTGSCQCVQAECAPRRSDPLRTGKHTTDPNEARPPIKSHLGVHKGLSDVLVKSQSHLDWKDVLLPAARAYFDKDPAFPSIHVADGYPNQTAVDNAPCQRLSSKHCFSADSIMYRAMRHVSVPAAQAEMVVLPVYQHCDGAEFLLHDLMKFAADTIKGVREGIKRTSLVLTHDWGICVAFAWEIWSARDKHTLYPDSIMRNTHVWSVMGDYDSPCYRPWQDSVVPARSCRTYDLLDAFPDVDHIRPARDRTQLVAWSGTHWGTGKSERLRLICDRGGAGRGELVRGGGDKSQWLNWDYMSVLSSARFCPQPRGIAGWSPRLSDAIFAGCIPVLIAEGTHYPYAHTLDWTKFSVRIQPTDLDRLEYILESIPLQRVEELQANMVLVRDAFLYSTDETPEDELSRRGPMFWGLHEMGMKMKMEYPADGLPE